MALFSPYALGATLYMPATRDDIVDVVFGERFPSCARWLSVWKTP